MSNEFVADFGSGGGGLSAEAVMDVELWEKAVNEKQAMEKIELKNCPFCGNPPQLIRGNAVESDCVNCTRCLFDFDGSVELWNARVESAELATLREQLHVAGIALRGIRAVAKVSQMSELTRESLLTLAAINTESK
jgi:hypothetical protein